jgi:class 3 adenylate cyclase/putative methionine-R-sulfoxide reductase with GAF domain
LTQSGHGAVIGIYVKFGIAVNRPGGDMQRRGGSVRPAKSRRTPGPKARKASKLSTAELQEQVGALRRDLKEAREQQTATSEVLKVISHSPGELGSAFKAMLENATRICDASYGIMFLREGTGFRTAAMHNLPRALAEERQRSALIEPIPEDPLTRLTKTKQKVHILDARTETAYRRGFAPFVALVKDGGARTLLVTPLLREGRLIGAFAIYRQEVRPFTERQTELVENFAAQAVIAIANTRLLSDLRESLQQQTATADILKVISSSPGALRPVFDAILKNATAICEAEFGQMFLFEGGELEVVAHRNVPLPLVKWDEEHGRHAPIPGGPMDQVLRRKQVVHYSDVSAEHHDHPLATLGGAKAVLSVPMCKEEKIIGALNIYRQEARAFTDTQIELVKNFAAQAVIAIEDARLLNELRQRTDDLAESLEQQTATSEVLKVISSSRGELEPVFQSMLDNATRICEAKFGMLWLSEGDGFRTVATHGVPPALAEERNYEGVIRFPPDVPLGRLALTKQLIHVADIRDEPAYVKGFRPFVRLADIGGARTLLVVPMLKRNELVGAISIYRQEVRPFADQQIELVKNFAAQAVIAIENARLLNDLNKLNQQLEQRVADQVSEIDRMGRLRRFLPPQVADLIVASGAEKQLESHRREITALFCDLRGFTGFSESSDPEDVMALLREYHAAIGGIINKYGGTLERYAGDGVMVVFNDPIPIDNPALQAVLMAIDMRAAIEVLIEKWRKLGHDIGFGIGIAHGFATLGTIGFEGRFDYAAIGTVSNVASRLCDEAKPGQILISPRVLMAVEKDIMVEPVGEFALKGIRRPLTAHNVLATKAAD